jgi:hypothetical protein
MSKLVTSVEVIPVGIVIRKDSYTEPLEDYNVAIGSWLLGVTSKATKIISPSGLNASY